MESYLPNDDDFQGAHKALARLQKTYNIPLEELMNGIVAGRKAQPLSQHDVLDVGLALVSTGLPDDAILWLTTGLSHQIPPLVNRQDFYHGLSRAHILVRFMNQMYSAETLYLISS